jgi:hypothetical protein
MTRYEHCRTLKRYVSGKDLTIKISKVSNKDFVFTVFNNWDSIQSSTQSRRYFDVDLNVLSTSVLFRGIVPGQTRSARLKCWLSSLFSCMESEYFCGGEAHDCLSCQGTVALLLVHYGIHIVLQYVVLL